MNKVLSGLFVLLFSAALAEAQSYDPIEQIGDVENKTITVTNPLTDVEKLIAGGASFNSSATNNTLNINAAVSDSNTTAPAGTGVSHYVAGGAVYNNTAAQNTVNVNANVTGKAVVGGLARVHDTATVNAEKWGTGSALNNSVNIKNANVTVAPQTDASVFFVNDADGNKQTVAVAGGASQFFNGDVSGNSVNIQGSTINGAVVGGLSYVQTTQAEVDEKGLHPTRNNDNNSVYIKDSTVNGIVYGSYGGVFGNGNTVTLDNATINGDAYAAKSGFTSYDDSSAAVGTFNNNTLNLLNGTKVQSAAAVSANNNNASYNAMNISGSTVQDGTLYAVKMVHSMEDNTATLAGVTDYNKLSLINTPTTAYEIGGAVNFTGSPSHNSVYIKDSDVTLTFDATKTFGGVMNVTNLTASKLLGTKDSAGTAITPALNTTNGYIFGGATADYVQTVAAGDGTQEIIKGFGKSADYNTVNIDGGTVNANIIGGFAAYVRQADYKVDTDEYGGYEEVHKVGLVTTTTGQTCTKDETSGTITCTNIEPTEETADKIDDEYSASYNTVILKNATVNGDVYGGYVDGAELKQDYMKTANNTVVIAGNTVLNGTVYGGSNAYFRDTNSLVFRNVANGNNFVEYKTSQFKNFNGLWTIEGNFDTRLAFDKGDVHALFVLDQSVMQDHAGTVVLKTGTDLDGYGPVNCNGSANCTKYLSDVQLSQNKLGIYTFYLTPQVNGGVIEWVLSNVKDKANIDAYGQLPLIGLALAAAGTDMISSTIENALLDDNESSSFVNAAYNDLRYKTASGFDLDSTVFHAGGWKKYGDFLLGVFGEYAHGSYDTFPIKVSGDGDSYAGGLMAAYQYSETGRLEANARVGSVSVNFDSAELVSSFKNTGMYYGAGAGFVEQVSSLSLYGSMNWLRKNAEDETDNLGQKIKFDAAQSLALKFGGRYLLNAVNISGFVPMIGVGGSYEFDGDSKVQVEDLTTDEPSLKGLTGRAEVGLFYDNQDPYMPLKTSLNLFGQAGQQQGWGGEVKVAFRF